MHIGLRTNGGTDLGWNRAYVLLIAGVLLGCAAALVVFLHSVRVPAVDLPRDSVLLGIAPIGSQLEAEFVVTNRGLGPLRLNVPAASCGCTSAVLSNQTVAPGGQAMIRVMVDTRGFQSRAEHDFELDESVDIDTNDRARPRIRLRVRGTMKRGFFGYPRALYFDGTRQVQGFAVKHEGPEKVIAVRSTDPHVKVSFNPDTQTVTAAVNRDRPVSASLILATNSDVMPELRVFVSSGIRP